MNTIGDKKWTSVFYEKRWNLSNHAIFKLCFIVGDWYLWCLSVNMKWAIQQRILDYSFTNTFYFFIPFYKTGALPLRHTYHLHFPWEDIFSRVMSIGSHVFSFLFYMKGELVFFFFFLVTAYILFYVFLFSFKLFFSFLWFLLS